jgi:1-acyl-sn-glycerol-3-phosphate acyltransferase
LTTHLRWLAKNVHAYALLGFGALFLAVECFAWAIVSTLLRPLLPARVGRRLGRTVAMRAFRLFLDVLQLAGAWRLDLSELDQLKDAGPLIVAPNHPGLLDAVLVVSRLPNAVCVMKTSLLHNFLLGPASGLARYVCNDSLLRLIARSGDELRLGGQLLLFPEGTRSVGGPIGPFTDAVGALSRRAGVPVQTVIIEADSAFLGKKWPLLTRPPFPMSFSIRLGRRFDPPADVRAFTAELERYFLRELAAGAVPRAAQEPAVRPIENATRLRG